jgi:hypothetical protein
LTIGTGSLNAGEVFLINTTVQFSAATDGIKLLACNLFWRNTASALISGTLPTTLFGTPQYGGLAVLEGVDLSALGSGKTLVSNSTVGGVAFYFINCKLGASVAIGGAGGGPGALVDVVCSDSSGTNYAQQRSRYEGTLIHETTIIRTGGASDGTTGISWNIATISNARWTMPFEAFPISVWNTTTGANRTVTLYGVWNAAALPNNDDIWFDVEYFGASGSPLASIGSGTKSNGLATGSAQTADSSAWDSLVAARQNSHAYSTGNVIKVASNPGRIFWCTAGGGSSAGSEPAGYASAVDGGSVTDSGVTFRAGVRFSMAVTLSAPQPQLVGYLRAIVKAAKASTTFYVDPAPVLS